MDFFSYSFRKQVFKSLCRKFIKNSFSHIKELDILLWEFCLISLREEFNINKNLFEIKKASSKMNKFEMIIKDLEEINKNLGSLKQLSLCVFLFLVKD